MPEYLAPGVYLEEVASGVKPIQGVSTSTAGFVGETARGPVRPTLVRSWTEFVGRYGAVAKDAPGEAAGRYLPHAVRGFFENGGTRLVVGRVTGRRAATSTLSTGSLTFRAVGPGSWGNSVGVTVRPAVTTPGLFALEIACGDLAETFEGLSTDPAHPAFAPGLVNPASEFVEITAAETDGIGSRAGYYEDAGALRDMVANHLLQLLTLTAMEPPVAFDANSVREEKVQVLRSIRRIKPEQVAERTVRAQYGPGKIDGERVDGYKEEERVAAGSVTETYAAVEFYVSNWRWSGVPFYVRTGKRLARNLTEVAVHLKRTPQALFARTTDEEMEPNVIVLRIQPDEGIAVTFGTKRPGFEMRTSTVNMDFCYQRAFGVESPDAYEMLLLDVMQGDATLFIRSDEAEAQWRLITPIEEAWKNEGVRELPVYEAGTDGPKDADKQLARNGHRWRPLNSVHGCGPV